MECTPTSCDPMRYGALRDIGTELGGAYLARERAAADPGQRRRWREAHLDIWDDVHDVDPGDHEQVTALMDSVAVRLRKIRAEPSER